MVRVSSNPSDNTALTWRPSPDDFIFIDTDLNSTSPQQNNGSITITIVTPTPAPTDTPTPPPNVGQITPTQTTCTQFRDHNAATLGSVQYSVRNGQISQVNPGVLFYWVPVTDGGTYTITQGTDFDSNYFTQAAGSFVYNSSCTKVDATISTTGGTTTVTFSGTGTFYIGIKYNTGSIVGASTADLPLDGTATYTFETGGVPGSAASVELVPKKP